MTNNINIIESKQIKHNINTFTDIVYENFIDLANYPLLKHTQEEIKKLMTSDKLYSVLVYNKNNSLIAYALGEFMNLNDGREVYYLSYIYVVSKYRKEGLGTKILNTIHTRCSNMGIKTIMLICDTEDKKVLDFYLFKGYMPDQVMRRYDRHDVLSLTL